MTIGSKRELRDHLKWLYSGLTGFCAVFFISLFSFYSSKEAKPDLSLEMAICSFAIALSIFGGCTIFHIAIVELDIHDSITHKILNTKLATWIPLCGGIPFFIGVITLIFHFNSVAGSIFIITSLIMYKILKNLIHKCLNLNSKYMFSYHSPTPTSMYVTYKGHDFDSHK